MMKEYIYNRVSLILMLTLTLALTACNDFLDELPDNRTEANTEKKIQQLLVAAYPTHDCMAFTEYASDNVDDMGTSNPNTTRFIDQCYTWTDITESNNQDPRRYWNDLYQCIETANMALEGIESMGGATTASLREIQSEALLCRAYSHFMLVNLFANHYDPNDATSLGVSYVTETEKELNPQYQRETVLENYTHIQEDLEAALPYVSDNYEVAKYHFNKNAAYAFATRFYLYIGEYDKAILYANSVLGSNPSTMLRNYKHIATLPREWNSGEGAIPMFMISATQNNNLILQTSYSSQQAWFGPYYSGKRYSHCAYIGTNETINALANALWSGNYTSYYAQVFRYSGTNLNAWVTWRLPWLFEAIDALGNGYSHTVHAMFTGDEVLLDRAEAYILNGQYDLAAQDITTWVQNIAKTSVTLTPQLIQSRIGQIKYSYDDENGVAKAGITSTLKKHLNPKFTIDEEGSLQESMLQAVIAMRRVETLHEGKRWFDIKRWGIEIPRRQMDSSGAPASISDWLTVDDLRRAIQIPQDIVGAGYEPNPRATSDDSGENLIPDEFLLK